MLQREVVFPVPPDRLWEALTEPESVSGWFGAHVEWDLTPGGRAHFVSADDGDRQGLVDDVSPGHHLRFRWWPEGDEDAVSEVSYRLDPDEAGTRLTVTERQVGTAPAPAPVRPRAAGTAGTTAWSACGLGRRRLDRCSSRWPCWPDWPAPVSTLDPDVVFAALGDATRRHLLDDLSRRGPLTATQLARVYPVSRQAVVKHLAALASAGLLVSDRHGREVRYRVDPDGIGDAARWLSDVGSRWDQRLAALQRHLE